MRSNAAVPLTLDRDELAWWSALSDGTDMVDFQQAWLALQCRRMQGVRQGVLVLGEPDVGPFRAVSHHPDRTETDPELLEVVDQCLQEREVVVATRAASLMVAYPVLILGRIWGVVAFQSVSQSPEPLIQSLRWGTGVLESRLMRGMQTSHQDTVDRLMYVVNSVANALREGRFRDVALALATDLAARLDCDCVSIGLRKSGRSRVYAVSHSSKFSGHMNLMHTLAEVMDEAIDQNTTLYFPKDEERAIQVRAHRHLAREFGNGHILTVPFAPDENARGALVFERPDSQPFDAGDIELCQSLVILVGRILYQRQRQERPLPVRWKDALIRELGRFVGPKYIGRKLLIIGMASLVAFGYFVQGPYRVNAQATVQGVIQRSLTAPFDGYIREAHLRAGDTVREGQLLATLDTRESELEVLRVGSLQEQYRRQAEEARARGDSAAAAIAQAQFDQATAQMRFYQAQVERASIVAPFDGVLVSGDLSQQLGDAVRRGQELFKLSPMDQHQLWLNVEDRSIDEVTVGQTGAVALAAMPDEPIPFTVTRVVPLAQVEEGKSIFRLEASLEGDAPVPLRPGMEGVGKIDIDERRYLSIWTHGFVEWFRLAWWRWFG